METLIFKLNRKKIKYLSNIRTIRTKITLGILNIKFGKAIRFYGKTIFSKYPGSKISIGDNCRFRSDKLSNLAGVYRNCTLSTLSEGALLSIGNRCGFSGTVIGAFKSIKIGDNVLFGVNCFVTDDDWHDAKNPNKRNSNIQNSKPVIIGDNVWVGMNSIILKGVTIGKNSVIGANSVVTKSIPENVIAGGNPCKVIKELDIPIDNKLNYKKEK